jgi:Golgi apparatus protein 1
LNYRLTQACGEVLKEVCVNVCPDEENMDKACGGTVLRCLADKIDDINDDTCKQELLYFQKMEVSLAGQVFSLCFV